MKSLLHDLRHELARHRAVLRTACSDLRHDATAVRVIGRRIAASDELIRRADIELGMFSL
ncbi:hypothetical protein [Sphingobium sp.]|uniref:hypothetical protein n=1 Tax=Sphingobium sp. TaxID=1912891 RepID=UPI00257CEBEF|nr:hypothetical protein [Sphingobium sp.]MBR2270398.1 hypothetical protein [Sphingobium sp.]